MTSRDRASRRWWLGLLVLLAAVRAAWLVADFTPMLFLGDSESYLETALNGWIPPDRSFVYGYVVRVLGVWPGSLHVLLAFQAACSVVAALLLAAAIRETVGDRRLLAGALAVAWAALEPLALLWERYLMAEACALPIFAALVVCGLRYLSTRRLRWILLANLAGIGVVAFRLPFAPVAWLGAVALPLLALFRRARVKRLLGHVLLSIAFTAILHGGYGTLYAALTQGPTGYQHADGKFLLAAWAPLLEAGDFPDPELGRSIIERSTCALRDRNSREMQRWVEGCVVSLLEKAAGDAVAANALARSTAFRILRRDPVGVARLALQSSLDYLDLKGLAWAMHRDRGESDYGARLNGLLAERFAIDATVLPQLSTPTNRLYFASAAWMIVLAFSPLFAWLAWLWGVRCAQGRSRQGAWIAIITSALLVSIAVAALRPLPRYLHPLGWLAPIWIAELLRLRRAPAPAARAVCCSGTRSLG